MSWRKNVKTIDSFTQYCNNEPSFLSVAAMWFCTFRPFGSGTLLLSLKQGGGCPLHVLLGNDGVSKHAVLLHGQVVGAAAASFVGTGDNPQPTLLPLSNTHTLNWLAFISKTCKTKKEKKNKSLIEKFIFKEYKKGPMCLYNQFFSGAKTAT